MALAAGREPEEVVVLEVTGVVSGEERVCRRQRLRQGLDGDAGTTRSVGGKEEKGRWKRYSTHVRDNDSQQFVNRPSRMISVPPEPLAQRVAALRCESQRLALNFRIRGAVRLGFEEAVGDGVVEDGVEERHGVEEGDDRAGVEGRDGVEEGDEGGIVAVEERE